MLRGRFQIVPLELDESGRRVGASREEGLVPAARLCELDCASAEPSRASQPTLCELDTSQASGTRELRVRDVGEAGKLERFLQMGLSFGVSGEAVLGDAEMRKRNRAQYVCILRAHRLRGGYLDELLRPCHRVGRVSLEPRLQHVREGDDRLRGSLGWRLRRLQGSLEQARSAPNVSPDELDRRGHGGELLRARQLAWGKLPQEVFVQCDIGAPKELEPRIDHGRRQELQVAAFECVLNGVDRSAVVVVPARGAPVELGHLRSPEMVQLRAQQCGEERVVAVGAGLRPDALDEDVLRHEALEHMRAVRPVRQHVGKLRRDLVPRSTSSAESRECRPAAERAPLRSDTPLQVDRRGQARRLPLNPDRDRR